MAAVGYRPPGDDHSVPGQVPPPTEPSAPAPAPISAPADTRPALLTPAVRPRYLRPTDSDAWPVGFSPTGEALPDTLTDVLLRGSHAIRSSKRAEAQRLERAAAVAHHVDAQIRDFLDFCAAERLTPPVTVRSRAPRPRRAGPDLRVDQPIPGLDAPLRQAGTQPRAERADDRHAEDEPDQDTRRGHRARQPRRPHRRERLQAWPLLYWRCESFPVAGRSLHLFVEPDGRAFEGRDDPAPLTVLGREVRVWPVNAAEIVAEMAEVDARRCALQLVHGMAHLLWRAGVGL